MNLFSRDYFSGRKDSNNDERIVRCGDGVYQDEMKFPRNVEFRKLVGDVVIGTCSELKNAVFRECNYVTIGAGSEMLNVNGISCGDIVIGTQCRFDQIKISGGQSCDTLSIGNYCDGGRLICGDASDVLIGANSSIGTIEVSSFSEVQLGMNIRCSKFVIVDRRKKINIACGSRKWYIQVLGLGSVNRMVTFYRGYDNIYVKAGCFFGTLDKFRAAVRNDCYGGKDGINHIKYMEYLGIANIAAYSFQLTNLVEHM